MHVHAWTHAVLPLPGSDHYPSLHSQFAINLPDRSHPINLLDFGAAYLSPSHPLSSSPFHTIQYLCLTTLTQLSPAKKFYQFQNYLNIHFPRLHFLLALIFQTIFYVLLKNSPTCSNLPPTPLFSLYLIFL